MKENTKKNNFVKLEDQPLSSYRYIAYGVGFDSIGEIANYFDIDEKELTELINNRKDTRKKIITGCVTKLRKYNLVYDGKPITVKEICEMTGLSRSVVEKRALRKWSAERIINTPKRKMGQYDLSVGGKTYATVNELAVAYGQKPVTVQYRLQKGMSAQEAVKPVQEKTWPCGDEIEVYVFGKKYSSLTKMCEEQGVKYSTAMRKKAEHPSVSWENIIVSLTVKTAGRYIVHGKAYPTLKQISEVYNVPYDPFWHYVRNPVSKKYGITFSTIEEILDFFINRDKYIPVAKQKKKKEKEKIYCFGKTYNSISEACREYKVSDKFVYQKLRYERKKENGLTAGQIIEYAKENKVGIGTIRQ